VGLHLSHRADRDDVAMKAASSTCAKTVKDHQLRIRQGLRGSEGSASYNCAEGGIELCLERRSRWGQHGISVNVICPLIQTDATDG